MKDKIYKIILITILHFCSIAVFGQTQQQQDLHNKYWFYRYRLTQEFLKKGLGTCGSPSGYSIPGSAAYGGGQEQEAQNLIDKCKEANVNAELLSTNNFEKLTKDYYFVCGGKQLDKESAQRIAREIKDKGFDAYAKDAGQMN